LDEAGRLAERERLEEQAIQRGERRCVYPDPERQGDQRGGSEAGTPPKSARGVAAILRQPFEPLYATLVTAPLLYLVDAAKLTPCRLLRLLQGHARRAIRRLFILKVCAHLLRHVGFESSSSKHPEEPES
jgi:hypothetical protein